MRTKDAQVITTQTIVDDGKVLQVARNIHWGIDSAV
jgi:hypothetical protein